LKSTRIDGPTLKHLVIYPENYVPNKLYPVVILLHGFGSNMHDIAAIAPHINNDNYIYACPNAPVPIDLGLGRKGFAWASLGTPPSKNEYLNSQDILLSFIRELTDSLSTPKNHVVLGGFSQGAMMTYRLGIPRPQQFAGLVALGGLLDDEAIPANQACIEKDQPIFIAHGTLDTVIPIESARDAKLRLENVGFCPTYKEYPIAHEINHDILTDLSSWLKDLFPSTIENL
jgi:phospholipase/carboxylesterase